jgi:hypothetical protein
MAKKLNFVKQPLTIILPVNMYSPMEKHCRKTRYSQNRFIRDAVREKLDRDEIPYVPYNEDEEGIK